MGDLADAVVTTSSGRVLGRADGGCLAFYGVPYAAPPVGPHRLRAPAPPDAWDGIRDATAPGPTAQRPEDESAGGIPEPSIAGDDVLTVNVFTPDLGPARLPVLVWIHGGGFTAGSPVSPWYHGGRFARDGAVVVTVGYRLGAEGFLLLDGAPPNRAVLDWIAALEWVQGEIAAFGGDPSAVTVGGQSAGGSAATTLMTVPRARGLFRRVISMSGVGFGQEADDARRLAADIAARLGVDATRDAVADRPGAALHAAQVALLRDRAADPAGSLSSPLQFAPVLDGEVVTAKPLAAVARGEGGDVDVLVGSTRDEMVAPVRARLAEAGVGDDVADAALGAMRLPADGYRRIHPGLTPAEMVGRAVTDSMFRSRVQSLLDARTAGGGEGATYAYEFRWRAPDLGLGAVHCLDIPFAFDRLDAPDVAPMAGDHPPQALADLMHRAWVGFVATGDPGWPAHEPERRPTMLFDGESGPADDPLRAERALWS